MLKKFRVKKSQILCYKQFVLKKTSREKKQKICYKKCKQKCVKKFRKFVLKNLENLC